MQLTDFILVAVMFFVIAGIAAYVGTQNRNGRSGGSSGRNGDRNSRDR